MHPNDEFINKQYMLVYSYLLSWIHTVTESPRGVPRAISQLARVPPQQKGWKTLVYTMQCTPYIYKVLITVMKYIDQITQAKGA